MTSPLRNLRKRNILLETSDEDMSVNWIIIYSIIIIIVIIGRKEWLIERRNCVVVLITCFVPCRRISVRAD